MGLFLQILGAIFLAIVLTIVAGVLFLRFKVRRLLRMMEEVAPGGNVRPYPRRIHLRAMAAPSWEDEDAVMACVEPLPGLGFAPIGLFQVEEVDGLNLSAWVNPADRAYAVVYEHPTAGAWVDFVTRYEDGTGVTYANTDRGEGIGQRPGFAVERLPGLETPALYERFLAGRPRKPMEHPSAEGFVGEFERAYADEMDWRERREGRLVEEIRALADASGDSDDESALADDPEQAIEDALDGLAARLRERFLATTSLTAAEWEKVRDRVIMVHDRMTPEYLDVVVSEHVDDVDWTPEGPAREVFAAFNQGLPRGRRFEKLGTVADPVEADVYVAPED